MSKKPAILIVDDEPLILQLLEIIIQSELEVEVYKAKDGAEAETLLKKHAPENIEKKPEFSVILSDYTMPKKTGGDLYLFNKSQDNLPFILLSGGDISSYPEMSDFHVTHPNNLFLQKPAEEEKIIDGIKSALNPDEDPIIDTNREERGFKKVKPYFLTKLAKSNFDLYIKLGDGKFLQITTKENKDMKAVLEHYQSKEKDISFFYLSQKDYETFFNQVNKLLDDFKN
ncbi:MAG: response regulator, partial [Halobacteriovoraceae bacterium]|nr:response regulator [Halobacteriovoraceae bacterium]